MNHSTFKTEIRDSVIRDLIEKVRKQNYRNYLVSIRLENIRLFHGAQINFDFPVTALIGPNGGGKSTILAACACIYNSANPSIFFRKSRIGDEGMDNWNIEYELIDKGQNPKGTIRLNLTFQKNVWSGNNGLKRPVKTLSITRTLPLSENPQIALRKKLTIEGMPRGRLSITTRELGNIDHIKREAQMILGKSLANFQLIGVTYSVTKTHKQKWQTISRTVLEDGSVHIVKKEIVPSQERKAKSYTITQPLYVGQNAESRYSEFNFGAGEASVIRTVAEIEALPDSSLVLIEEIENGLHPVALRRLVEYLIEVANRKSIQIVFTTHNDFALDPLPSEAIWASIDGKLRQGKLSVEDLRAVSGRVDRRLAIFVEDNFAKAWVEAILREKLGASLQEIGVYPLQGDGNAVKTHLGHFANPAISFHSVCFIDGDSRQAEDREKQIFRLPGSNPESTVFNSVVDNLDNNIAFLTVACQRTPDKQEVVADAVRKVAHTNRDPHNLFNQIGLELGWVSEAIVRGAFLTVWIEEHPNDVERIVGWVKQTLELPPKTISAQTVKE